VFSRGVDSECFSPAYRKQSQTITALYVGRVSAEKNLGLLAKVFRNRSDVKLKIVGDGPYRGPLESSLPQACFTGFLTGIALSEAFASADFFVFPSETDTFGNVILEAMSSGLPVLVSDRMGPKELVSHGENGFIAGSEQDFSLFTDRLVQDPEMRSRMSWKARETALSRSWDNVFAGLFDLYFEVIDQSASAGFVGLEEQHLDHSWGATC
jgi:glycosyltransferase involved in cell wall biosynthesis